MLCCACTVSSFTGTGVLDTFGSDAPFYDASEQIEPHVPDVASIPEEQPKCAHSASRELSMWLIECLEGPSWQATTCHLAFYGTRLSHRIRISCVLASLVAFLVLLAAHLVLWH